MPDENASPPAAERTETAADLLRALRRLEAEGKVAIRTDAKRLNHIDSPVVVEADSNIWIYALIAAVLLAWWGGGGLAALAAAVAGTAAYFTLGRAYIRRRLDRRVREGALHDLDRWRRLWRFGGVALAARGAAGAVECRAPDGNWMAFVRALAEGGADEEPA